MCLDPAPVSHTVRWYYLQTSPVNLPGHGTCLWNNIRLVVHVHQIYYAITIVIIFIVIIVIWLQLGRIAIVMEKSWNSISFVQLFLVEWNLPTLFLSVGKYTFEIAYISTVLAQGKRCFIWTRHGISVSKFSKDPIEDTFREGWHLQWFIWKQEP